MLRHCFKGQVTQFNPLFYNVDIFKIINQQLVINTFLTANWYVLSFMAIASFL